MCHHATRRLYNLIPFPQFLFKHVPKTIKLFFILVRFSTVCIPRKKECRNFTNFKPLVAGGKHYIVWLSYVSSRKGTTWRPSLCFRLKYYISTRSSTHISCTFKCSIQISFPRWSSRDSLQRSFRKLFEKCDIEFSVHVTDLNFCVDAIFKWFK